MVQGTLAMCFVLVSGASIWNDISRNIDAPFNALALDGTNIPSSIYVRVPEFGVSARSMEALLGLSLMIFIFLACQF